jgi:hypothetical protein
MTELRNLRGRINELETDLRDRDEEVKLLKDQQAQQVKHSLNGSQEDSETIRVRIWSEVFLLLLSMYPALIWTNVDVITTSRDLKLKSFEGTLRGTIWYSYRLSYWLYHLLHNNLSIHFSFVCLKEKCVPHIYLSRAKCLRSLLQMTIRVRTILCSQRRVFPFLSSFMTCPIFLFLEPSHGEWRFEEDFGQGPVAVGHVSGCSGSAAKGSGGNQPAIRRSS